MVDTGVNRVVSFSGSAAAGLFLAGGIPAGLVSDLAIPALPLLCLGLWRGVVGCARAAQQKPIPD